MFAKVAQVQFQAVLDALNEHVNGSVSCPQPAENRVRLGIGRTLRLNAALLPAAVNSHRTCRTALMIAVDHASGIAVALAEWQPAPRTLI